MRIREVTALRVSQGHGLVGLRTASVRAWHVARSFMRGGRAPVLAPAPRPKPILAYHSSTRGGTGFRHGSPAPTPVAASGTHTGTEGWPASSATACMRAASRKATTMTTTTTTTTTHDSDNDDNGLSSHASASGLARRTTWGVTLGLSDSFLFDCFRSVSGFVVLGSVWQQYLGNLIN